MLKKLAKGMYQIKRTKVIIKKSLFYKNWKVVDGDKLVVDGAQTRKQAISRYVSLYAGGAK